MTLPSPSRGGVRGGVCNFQATRKIQTPPLPLSPRPGLTATPPLRGVGNRGECCAAREGGLAVHRAQRCFRLCKVVVSVVQCCCFVGQKHRCASSSDAGRHPHLNHVASVVQGEGQSRACSRFAEPQPTLASHLVCDAKVKKSDCGSRILRK